MFPCELQCGLRAGQIVARPHCAALEKIRRELRYGEVMFPRYLAGDRPIRSSEVASGSLAELTNVFEETP